MCNVVVRLTVAAYSTRRATRAYVRSSEDLGAGRADEEAPCTVRRRPPHLNGPDVARVRQRRPEPALLQLDRCVRAGLRGWTPAGLGRSMGVHPRPAGPAPLELAARAGYVARGVMYLLIGGFALWRRSICTEDPPMPERRWRASWAVRWAVPGRPVAPSVPSVPSRPAQTLRRLIDGAGGSFG